MATETLGGLYIRLGLSLSELESDFADAERTMNQNMARLNRQQNLIRLRAEVEIGNLDESADAAQILTVRTRALNEQMAIQRDRIRIATANLQDMTQRHGESAAVTQRAAQALERERLQLQRYERELREVERAQRELNDAQEESAEGINNFSDALDNFAGKVAGLAVVAEVFNTISETVNEANENFKELQNQSFELNLPVGQTKEFLRELKLAGGEIGDFEGYIRGITDAYVKGEFDDPEFIALSKYGAKITDAQGRLKDFASITEEVYQAYLKAKEAGEGIEFLQLTGGEAGVRDAIQYFERLKEAKEDAAKVFNADFDAGAYHDLDRTLNVLTEQTDEFKNAIAAIFTPAVQSSAESLFEIFRAGTQFLTENKEEFKSWGFIAAEVINSVLDPLKELKTSLEDTKIGDNSVFGALKDTAKNFVGNIAIGPSFILYKMADAIGLTSDLTARANEKQIEYNNSIKEASKSWADFQQEQEKSEAKGNPLNLYDTKRITQFRDELADLRIELDYADDEYAKAMAQADLWLQRELIRKNNLSSDEEIAIRELHAAKVEQIEREKAEKLEQIEKERAERITELQRNTADIEYSLTHSAFEKQLRDIEQWKQAQLEKADTAEEVAATIQNAAMKEAEAFEREMDRIKGTIQSAQDRLARLTMSQKDYDKYSAEKEYKQDIKNGVPKEIADAIYDARMKEIKSRAIKGGDYVKTPAGGRNSNYSEYFRNFTPNLENKNKSLIDLDADALAYDAALEKSKKAVDEFGNSLDKSKSKADEVINGADLFNQSLDAATGTLQNADSSLNNLDGTVEGIVAETDNFKDKISQNADALNDASTAAGTFEQALENIQDIKEQNSLRQPTPNIPSPDTDGGYRMGIIKGTDIAQVNSDLINQSADVVNQITPAFEQLETAAQDLSLSIADAAPSISSAISEQTEGISAGISSVSGALSGLTAGTDSVSSALQNTAATLENVNQRIFNSNFQPSQNQQQPAQQPNQPNNQTPNLSPEVVNTAFNVVSALGDIAALGGAVTGNVPVALLGTGVSAFANAANAGYDAYNLKNEQQPNQLNSVNADINAAIEKLSNPLQELSQRTGDIATSVETIKRQKPTINVSPTVNVNLGGAYVFDNAMKARLTDDVSNEVVQAVTDVFEQALNQSGYGYGN